METRIMAIALLIALAVSLSCCSEPKSDAFSDSKKGVAHPAIIEVSNKAVVQYESDISIDGHQLEGEFLPIVYGGVVYLPVDALNSFIEDGFVSVVNDEEYIQGYSASKADFIMLDGSMFVRLPSLDDYLDYDKTAYRSHSELRITSNWL